MNVHDRPRGAPEPATVTPRPDHSAGSPIRMRLRAYLGAARRHPILSVLLLAIVLGVAGYQYFRTEEATGKPIIATVARGSVENVVTAIGSLQPLNYVDVGAQVSGQLKSIPVNAGDHVNKGDLVAEIDSTVASAKVDADDAQLQNLRAQLLEKQSNLVLANAQAERQTRLKNDNATSQDLYDSAMAAQRSADAQVKAVQAQITQSESQLKADQATLGYAKIYAPMTGTIASISAKPGQTLNANQQAPTILQIADLTVMTVSTQVAEADVPKLRIGMPAYFTTLGDPNRRWTGTLRQILPTPTVTNNVVLYTALFDVANPNQQLMTQMTAQVFFVISAAYNVVTVPVSALHYTDRGAAAQGARGANANAGGNANAGAAGRGQNVAQGGGRQGGRGQGRRGGGAQEESTGQVRPRPATVTVVRDDGSTETRNVVVGVADRVNAEIRSGLSEGEMIVVGTQLAAANRPAANANNNGGRGGFGRGPGGFGGFGGAP